jgi:chromosome partitioning protein
MTTVIAVANQKGGVAKTTTSVSLGGALAQSGFETLMIDLDPQADLTLALGFSPARLHGVIADVLLHASSLKEVTRETAIPGLDLVASSSEMDLAERFLPVRPNYEYLLREAIHSHLPTGFYDFIILDCPPALSSVTLNALNAAHTLLIPTQPEYFSVHSLRNMIPLIRRVRSQSNPGLAYRILITMHDRRNRIHRNLSEQLRAAFSDGVLQTVIDVDTKLRESSLAGLPITHYNPKSRSATQYQALAQEFVQYVQETAGKTAPQAA